MSTYNISKYSENFISIIDQRLKQIEQDHLKKLNILIHNYNICYQHILANQSQIKNNQNDILTILEQLISKTSAIQSHLDLLQNRITLFETQNTHC